MKKTTPSKRRTSTKKRKPQKNTLKKGLLKFILGTSFIVFILCTLLVLTVWSGLFAPLPKIQELKNIKQKSASLLYASNGELIGKYYTENRETIDNENIAPHVRHALIATEDNRFFEHNGFDLISLGRVFVKTILLGNTSQGGGSTISQQLAKNLYPRLHFKVLSLPLNKIREIFIASRLEKAYSKDEILALYLNTVPFGEDVYGIEAAARRFFNKKATELSIAESATLVGMLAANTAYSPRLHPELSMKRRNIVISRMVVQGFVSEALAEELKQDSIHLDYTLMDASRGLAPYFRMHLHSKVKSILDNLYEGRYNIETDGLRIFTTINADLQRYAEDAVDQHMRQLQAEFDKHWDGRDPLKAHPEIFESALEKTQGFKQLEAKGLSKADIKKELKKIHQTNILTHQGEKSVKISTIDSLRHYLKMLNTGFLALNPQSGAILSWVGGINYKYLPFDHVSSQRQVGSTFKPIVYATALAQGVSPCEIYSNERRVYEAYDGWSPSNANGKHEGYYSFKGALANSVNTVTAEIMMQTGISDVISTARQMGITSDIPEVPSIALGTASLSLFEMVKAYSTFASGTKPEEPYGILRIEDSNGQVLYEHKQTDTKDKIFDEKTILYMNAMLQGVIDRGTGKALRNIYGLHFDLAGKTGTTQNNADGWFIGYTPKIVAGVWVGAEQPAVHFRSTALGQGAHMALPIFGLTMQKVVKDKKLAYLTDVPFKLLSPRMSRQMECEDFYEHKPERGLINILIDLFDKKDSVQVELKALDKRPEKQKTKKGFFNRLKELFKND